MPEAATPTSATPRRNLIGPPPEPRTGGAGGSDGRRNSSLVSGLRRFGRARLMPRLVSDLYGLGQVSRALGSALGLDDAPTETCAGVHESVPARDITIP